MIEEAGKGGFCEKLLRYSNDQNSASLSRGRVGGADEVLLTYVNVVLHLMFDVTANPYYGGKRRQK